RDLALQEPVHHRVRPPPVELVGERLHPVPGHAPADRLQPEVRCQAQVLPPVLVVPHEQVLVEGAVPGALLRHEGVLHPAGPDEVLGPGSELHGLSSRGDVTLAASMTAPSPSATKIRGCGPLTGGSFPRKAPSQNTRVPSASMRRRSSWNSSPAKLPGSGRPRPGPSRRKPAPSAVTWSQRSSPSARPYPPPGNARALHTTSATRSGASFTISPACRHAR